MEKSINYALSSSDLKNIFDDKLKIMVYSDLKKYDNINELLSPFNRVCILYNWEPAVGHWTCLFKGKDNKIYFFDSFGSKPDGKTNMGQVPPELRYKRGMDYKYLTDLLLNSPYEIDFNDKCLQDSKSSTCGRYCVVRMSFSDLSTDDFNSMFSDDLKNNDKIICYLTNN
jgi:hypothetical protein